MSRPRAGDLVARMNAVGNGSPAPAPAGPELPTPPASATAAASRRSGGGRRRRAAAGGAVHYTIDLENALHLNLRIWALNQGVDASEVVRTLIELLDDPIVSQAVMGRLATSDG